MKDFEDTIIPGVIIILIVIIAIFVDIHLSYGEATTYNGYTVTDKAVKNDKDDSKYLVYTKDSKGDVMVFSVEDRFWIGRFDASDDYAKIEIGKTYNFDTVGIRVHFYSSYPCIIDMKEIK